MLIFASKGFVMLQLVALHENTTSTKCLVKSFKCKTFLATPSAFVVKVPSITLLPSNHSRRGLGRPINRNKIFFYLNHDCSYLVRSDVSMKILHSYYLQD